MDLSMEMKVDYEIEQFTYGDFSKRIEDLDPGKVKECIMAMALVMHEECYSEPFEEWTPVDLKHGLISLKSKMEPQEFRILIKVISAFISHLIAEGQVKRGDQMMEALSEVAH